MSSSSGGASPDPSNGNQGSWFSRHTGPLIGAAGALAAAGIGVLFAVDPAPTPGPPAPPDRSPTAREATIMPTRETTIKPPAEPTRTTEPPAPPRPPAAKARWKGVATLPLSTNQNSDEGAELDGKSPGQLVGVDDDLRGDFSTSASIMVMSGHVAEASGDAYDLERAKCEKKVTAGVAKGPTWVSIYRGNAVGGTYCMTTTEGHLAAFTIVSAEQLPLPVSVTVKVILWD